MRFLTPPIPSPGFTWNSPPWFVQMWIGTWRPVELSTPVPESGTGAPSQPPLYPSEYEGVGLQKPLNSVGGLPVAVLLILFREIALVLPRWIHP